MLPQTFLNYFRAVVLKKTKAAYNNQDSSYVDFKTEILALLNARKALLGVTSGKTLTSELVIKNQDDNRRKKRAHEVIAS